MPFPRYRLLNSLALTVDRDPVVLLLETHLSVKRVDQEQEHEPQQGRHPARGSSRTPYGPQNPAELPSSGSSSWPSFVPSWAWTVPRDV